MAIYVVLSKLHNKNDSGTLKDRAKKVHDATHAELPGSKWSGQYYMQGGEFDLVDVVETDDPAATKKISEIIKRHGQADVSVLSATPWKEHLARV